MNDRQLQLRAYLTQRSTKNDDWLRAGVASHSVGAAAFFRSATGEIIASQIGNQYFLSTSTQLEYSRKQALIGNLEPLGWFLFNLDLVGASTVATFYENERDRGKVDARTVQISRAPGHGKIVGLRVPGCGDWTFSYDDPFVPPRGTIFFFSGQKGAVARPWRRHPRRRRYEAVSV